MNENPFELFEQWYEKSKKSEPEYPDAFTLSTLGLDGYPNGRIVLLKDFSVRGFVFYTNYESQKGQEILAHSKVSMCFHWKTQNRQVRIVGEAVPVSDQEADEYFATRPRLSQIGAWASKQSQPLESRFELEKRVAEYTARFHVGKIPRPPHWSGFCVSPVRMEFWDERPFRLHDRLVFTRLGDVWKTQRIFP